jgi:hypothetical protein
MKAPGVKMVVFDAQMAPSEACCGALAVKFQGLMAKT